MNSSIEIDLFWAVKDSTKILKGFKFHGLLGGKLICGLKKIGIIL